MNCPDVGNKEVLLLSVTEASEPLVVTGGTVDEVSADVVDDSTERSEVVVSEAVDVTVAEEAVDEVVELAALVVDDGVSSSSASS